MSNTKRPYWSNKAPEAGYIEQLKRELATEKEARERAEDAFGRVAQMGIEAEQRIEQLEEQLRQLGACPDCGQVEQMDEGGPFSSCACGTEEDYGHRPLQQLQLIQRQRIEQLEAQMQRARELAAQWRSQIDDTDDAFYARGVAAGYRRCADELEAALAQPQEIDKLVWCDCGDGFPVRSYGAGYMAAAGKCENCDAAEADR